MLRDTLISRFYLRHITGPFIYFRRFYNRLKCLPASSFALIFIAAISGTVQSFPCNLEGFHV